jgi:hypothetical protein
MLDDRIDKIEIVEDVWSFGQDLQSLAEIVSQINGQKRTYRLQQQWLAEQVRVDVWGVRAETITGGEVARLL